MSHEILHDDASQGLLAKGKHLLIGGIYSFESIQLCLLDK